MIENDLVSRAPRDLRATFKSIDRDTRCICVQFRRNGNANQLNPEQAIPFSHPKQFSRFSKLVEDGGIAPGNIVILKIQCTQDGDQYVPVIERFVQFKEPVSKDETQTDPTDLVTAVLCRVGCNARITADATFHGVFGQAALDHPQVFGLFATHKVYGDSRFLYATMQALCLGGIIMFEGVTSIFTISMRALGKYGQGKYRRLSEAEKAAVNVVANNIRQIYGLRQP